MRTMPSPSTVNMQPVYFPYCKYQSFVGVVRLPERSNTIIPLSVGGTSVRVSDAYARTENA